MPFYEVIYETGSKSVAFADSDEEMARGLAAQETRARSGLPGGPTGHPAERIADVLVYDKHPNELNPAQTVSAEVAKKIVADSLKKVEDENGVVALHDLTQDILTAANPSVDGEDARPLESMYKMKESRKLDRSQWQGSEA